MTYSRDRLKSSVALKAAHESASPTIITEVDVFRRRRDLTAPPKAKPHGRPRRGPQTGSAKVVLNVPTLLLPLFLLLGDKPRRTYGWIHVCRHQIGTLSSTRAAHATGGVESRQHWQRQGWRPRQSQCNPSRRPLQGVEEKWPPRGTTYLNVAGGASVGETTKAPAALDVGARATATRRSTDLVDEKRRLRRSRPEESSSVKVQGRRASNSRGAGRSRVKEQMKAWGRQGMVKEVLEELQRAQQGGLTPVSSTLNPSVTPLFGCTDLLPSTGTMLGTAVGTPRD